jgi:hypothetical protein
MSSPDVTKLYNATDKTKFMIDKIEEMWFISEHDQTIKSTLRYDRDCPLARFAQSIKKIGFTLDIKWDRMQTKFRAKENVTTDDIANVAQELKIAYNRFCQVMGHIRSLGQLNDIMPILEVLDTISCRINDGQEWHLHREANGKWKVYIMDEGNTWRTEKNPVVDGVEEYPRNPPIIDHPPVTNPDAVQTAQLLSMLERVQHSMR